MSSTYRRICLSHTPPLVLDEEVGLTVPPEQPPEHPDCKIALGRYSYPLIEIWLPIQWTNADGVHPGEWFDVSWVSKHPEIARLILADLEEG